MWLSVAESVNTEHHVKSSHNIAREPREHLFVPVSIEAFARVKKGDQLVLAIVRGGPKGLPGFALERL